ncbi:MAG: tRNA pseudouridine(55) synthase TruB [Actinomycetaceae bacterium]|nr:tRNA pseudouridine(55) synthase TruB [Actinomycetaceae bacterium]
MARNASGPDGLVVVDKEAGMTSHDVVARMRRLAGTRKVGHAGTLDPMATGVLCVGLGRATKLLRYVVGTDKEYEATIRLGVETSTDDAEGQVLARRGIAVLDGGTDAEDGAPASAAVLARIDEQIATMRGTIDQIPSSVSAVKVGGRRAYERVRSGEDVELAARAVEVHSFERLGAGRQAVDGGVAVIDVDVRVVCGAGTYIRALARDLGRALGTGGHLTRLRRTRVGAWDESQAWRLTDLADGGAASQDERLPITGVAQLCESLFARVEVSAEEAEDLAMGRFVDARRWGPSPSHVTDTAVAWCDSSPVALVSARGGRLKPDLLLRPSGKC